MTTSSVATRAGRKGPNVMETNTTDQHGSQFVKFKCDKCGTDTYRTDDNHTGYIVRCSQCTRILFHPTGYVLSERDRDRWTRNDDTMPTGIHGSPTTDD